MPGEIFYYVHHDGGGHRSRARAICRHLGKDVTLLSSLDPPTDLDDWRPPASTANREWVVLPWDTGTVEDPRGEVRYRDPTANGQLHWVPAGHPGLLARHRMLLSRMADRAPALLVADVSVEIATLARLCGIPVVMVLLPGRRDDPAHQRAFALSTGLLAPWPRPPVLPEWLQPFASRTLFAGGIGADSPPAVPIPAVEQPAAARSPAVAGRHVVAAFGSAGPPPELVQDQQAPRKWSWEFPTADRPAAEWRAHLGEAAVVVAHAGLGTIADLAAARARAIVIPQPRPFDEQGATAALLVALDITRVLRSWPAPQEWNRLLDKVFAAPVGDWDAWGTKHGARSAAGWLSELAG